MAEVLESLLWSECRDAAVPAMHLPVLCHTTLFELIAAVQDAAGPDDDTTVVAVLAEMLQHGRIYFLEKAVQSRAAGRGHLGTRPNLDVYVRAAIGPY